MEQGTSSVWFSTSNNASVTMADVESGHEFFLHYNSDPPEEVDVNVCVQCYAQVDPTLVMHTSNMFNIKIRCPDYIEAFEPTIMSDPNVKNQTDQVSASTDLQYEFDSYLTKTKACPII